MTITTRIAAMLCSLLTLTACSEDEDGRIVIGRGFELTVPNTLQYQVPVVVQVTENNGTPSSGTVVTITVDTDRYFKGRYIETDIDGDLEPDAWRITSTGFTECTSEDANDNGILDGGEDTNGNGVLDPANAATISPHPDITAVPTVSPGSNTIVTDTSGFGYFSLVYPKSQASWVRVTLTARVGDGSPGNTQSDTFTLPVLLADLDDINVSPPGGSVSAYGSATVCTDPN